MLDKFRDAAVIFEFGSLGLACLRIGGPLIGERNQQTLVQKREFAQALRQSIEVVVRGSEDLFVGNEVNFRAALFGSAGLLQLAGGFALGVSLLPGKSITPDFELQFVAERVHAGHAHAVQSARNFVGRCIELAAGMQPRHHYFSRRQLLAVDLHLVHRNAAAVIDNGDGIVDVDCNFNFVGEAGERLVHRIIYNFVNQMVKTQFAGRANVHRGALANCFHAAQHFDRIGSVVPVASVVSGDGGDPPVLSFGVGNCCCVDFFGGHSAPLNLPFFEAWLARIFALMGQRDAFSYSHKPDPKSHFKLLKLFLLRAPVTT